MKARIKVIQRKLGVMADGIIGNQTLAALEAHFGIAGSTQWPTQADVRSGKSVFGKAGNEGALVNINPPYPLFYDGQPVRTIRVHERVACEVEAALREVLEHYGPERIHGLGLDIYDGGYNYRKTTSGSSMSMHAWGIALDFDAEHNAMSMHAPQARFSAPEYEPWWEIWERHGAVSMGRAYDKDWMHLQFAKF